LYKNSKKWRIVNNMIAGQQPIIILREGTTRETGKNARMNNIIAVVAISDIAKSTLGPRGMDKMLVDSTGDVTITNDGATILKEMDVEHPAAKMIIEVAKSQDQECGDGTTTAVILTGELLKNANELIDKKIHPTTINEGYKIAAEKAIETLRKIAIPINADDKITLYNISITAMSSKGHVKSKKLLAEVVVDAVTSIIEKKDEKIVVDLDNIQIQKQPGSTIEDTEIVKGLILDKEPVHKEIPKHIKNAKIALIKQAIEIKKTEVEARIQIRNPSQLQAFLDEEERMIQKMVDKVQESGANVLICQKGIDDIAQYLLTKHSIYATHNVKEGDMKKLSKATGGKIVSYIEELTSKDLGYAGVVEEKKYGDDTFTFIRDCKNPKAVSILLRGGTEYFVDELERAVHDSLSVVRLALEDREVTIGGGASAMEISMTLKNYAPSVGGRQQMAIEAFAEAIEIIPKTLSKNAGLDPIDILLQLKNQHKKGKTYDGLNVMTGKVENMLKNNIIEPLCLGIQEIQAAFEASTMILRIDDVIASKGGGRGMPSGPSAGSMGGDMDDY
jgi:thermosome